MSDEKQDRNQMRQALEEFSSQMSDPELKRMLMKALRQEKDYSRGFLTAREIDLYLLLAVYPMMHEEEGEAKELYQEYLLSVFRMVDEAFEEGLDRHVWETLGKVTHENRFDIFDQEKPKCLSEKAAEEGQEGEAPFGSVEGYETLRKLCPEALRTSLCDPQTAFEALTYIRKRRPEGRAAHIVEQWMLQDVRTSFEKKPEPEGLRDEIRGYAREIRMKIVDKLTDNAQKCEQSVENPHEIWHLTDPWGMEFEPSVEIVKEKEKAAGRKTSEVRALSWYRNKLWLLRRFETGDTEESRNGAEPCEEPYVLAYELYGPPFGPKDLYFLVREDFDQTQLADQDGSEKEPAQKGMSVTIPLIDLTGHDTCFGGKIDTIYPGQDTKSYRLRGTFLQADGTPTGSETVLAYLNIYGTASTHCIFSIRYASEYPRTTK